uniref:Chromosome 17 open reading frame 64 n=1 Tax=Athene cunicularia TaxID=194338 RepID=A0A663MB64_ATHCN
GSESAPPCKTPLICCADGLDEDTFKICKELFRPFKKSLKKLQSPQHLPREKQLKYMKESLTIIGDRIDTFLQQYCRASEVKHWQKMFWQFISLFSKMDGKQLQKLYKYIKNNQIDKFVVSKQQISKLFTDLMFPVMLYRPILTHIHQEVQRSTRNTYFKKFIKKKSKPDLQLKTKQKKKRVN